MIYWKNLNWRWGRSKEHNGFPIWQCQISAQFQTKFIGQAMSTSIVYLHNSRSRRECWSNFNFEDKWSLFLPWDIEKWAASCLPVNVTSVTLNMTGQAQSWCHWTATCQWCKPWLGFTLEPPVPPQIIPQIVQSWELNPVYCHMPAAIYSWLHQTVMALFDIFPFPLLHVIMGPELTGVVVRLVLLLWKRLACDPAASATCPKSIYIYIYFFSHWFTYMTKADLVSGRDGSAPLVNNLTNGCRTLTNHSTTFHLIHQSDSNMCTCRIV